MITIPGLDEKDNEEFNCLLNDLCNGHYWACEGYSKEHDEMQPKAEQALQAFLDKKLTK